MRIKINDRIPDFKYRSAFGKEGHFYDRPQKPFTVLCFLRFMGCRFTQYDLLQLQKHRKEFQAANAEVFAVIQSPVESVKAHFAGNPPDMALLCDPDSRIYQAFGVFPAKSLEEMQGRYFSEKLAKVEAAGLVGGKKEGQPWQLPAAFVINAQNQAVYAYYGTEAADMPAPEKLLAAMKQK